MILPRKTATNLQKRRLFWTLWQKMGFLLGLPSLLDRSRNPRRWVFHFPRFSEVQAGKSSFYQHACWGIRGILDISITAFCTQKSKNFPTRNPGFPRPPTNNFTKDFRVCIRGPGVPGYVEVLLDKTIVEAENSFPEKGGFLFLLALIVFRLHFLWFQGRTIAISITLIIVSIIMIRILIMTVIII